MNLKLMEHFQRNLRRIRPNEYYKVSVGGEWFRREGGAATENLENS
jgi:hypothetical protein